MTEWPRITLVTPSFQQGRYLQATIDSVLSQGYPNLEYRIMDGGSRDESVGIIRRHAQHLDCWVSEADAGQSDALIKGFANATGEIMNWLNADDLLRPGALHAVAQAWRQRPTALIVGEDDQFTLDPGMAVGHFSPSGHVAPDCLRFWSGRFRYHQPPTFFSRAAYLQAGGLRADLHYVMDFDLYCRMLLLPNTEVQLLPQTLTAFRLHPEAKTARSKAGFLRELRAVSRSLWPVAWNHADETEDMNRYCAECSVYQAAEAVRAGDIRALLQAARAALGYAPVHTLRVLIDRAARRAHA